MWHVGEPLDLGVSVVRQGVWGMVGHTGHAQCSAECQSVGVVQRASGEVERFVQRRGVLEALVARRDRRMCQWLSRAGGTADTVES